MSLPVWVASWELDCCQPEAEVGGAWSVPLSFAPGLVPWWAHDHGVNVSDEQAALGRVKLDVSLVEEGAHPVFASGPIRFHGPVGMQAGQHTGRLHLNGHPAGARPLEHVTCDSTVTSITVVPVRYEEGETMFVPSEQLKAFEVQTTLDRSQVSRALPRHEGDFVITPELIVWADFSEPNPG